MALDINVGEFMAELAIRAGLREMTGEIHPRKLNTGKLRTLPPSIRKEEREAAKAAEEAERNKVTIGKIWEEYQVIRANKKSLVTDQYNFKNHLTDFADKRPEDLITLDIQKFRVKLENEGLSPASVKHSLVLLRMLINWSVNQGICAAPDPAKLHFDISKLDNERTEMLSEKQIKAYLEALDKEANQNLAALFRFALVTGMRKSALFNLKWADCDFENKVIVLRGEVAKKGHTERIPTSDMALTLLQAVERGNSEYVFPGKDGGPRKVAQDGAKGKESGWLARRLSPTPRTQTRIRVTPDFKWQGLAVRVAEALDPLKPQDDSAVCASGG